MKTATKKGASSISKPERDYTVVTVRLPANIVGLMKERADQDRRTVSSWLRVLIEDALGTMASDDRKIQTRSNP
jgi:hypothetical protein